MMTKQKGFVAVLLMTTFFTPMRADAACTPMPDCAELGYTQTLDECPDSAVKCPWDTSKVFCSSKCECGDLYKYTCTGTNETAGEHKCGDKYAECGCLDNAEWVDEKCRCKFGYSLQNGKCVRPSCKIADIFYTDYTCVSAANHDSTKEVLGIVVYVNSDGVGGQIMTPWPIDENGKKSASDVAMQWSTETVDVAGLTNYVSDANVSKDYNSCGNTDIIVEQNNASKYLAALATRKYAPNEAVKGKWCLPAAGIMTNIYNNKNAIQTAISKVGGVTFPNSGVWSSSEYDRNLVWYSYFYSSYGLSRNGVKSNNDGSVRPVLEF